MTHELYREVSQAVQEGAGDDRLMLMAMLAGSMPRRDIERAIRTARAARERVSSGS